MPSELIGSDAPPPTGWSAAVRFARLCEDEIPRIHAFVARRVADRTAVEELTTTVFDRALAVLRDGSVAPEALTMFIYRVATSAVLDHARRERQAIPRGARAADFDHPGDRERAQQIGDERATRAFEASLDRDALRRAVAVLPPDHQRAVILRYFDGLAGDELAAVLGCEPEAVAVQVHRALRSLRGSMEREAAGAA
jgi:RNA polymerase sigma factor (sigma-70 family)